MGKQFREIDSLFIALELCASKNKLITSDKLSEGESIHCCNGRFYYEDGCFIGHNTIHAFNVLSRLEWTKDAKWYDIGTFTMEEYKQIRQMHELNEAYPASFDFLPNFDNLVNSMKGHPVWEILEKASFSEEEIHGLEEMYELFDRTQDRIGKEDFSELYKCLTCSSAEAFNILGAFCGDRNKEE